MVLRSVIQVDETDEAVAAIIHEPQEEVDLGSLHPAGSLYQKSTNKTKAQEASHNLQKMLKLHGISVYKVHKVLAKAKRESLLELAMSSLHYELSSTSTQNSETTMYYLSDKYKRETLEALSSKSLVKIILNRPVVELSEAAQNTHVTVDYIAERPLGNLVFTRDQQIVTAKGVVMGHLHSPQREPESIVMELVFKTLEVPIVGKIPKEHYLEGGDFIPFGEDLCFIGTGLRTTEGAVQYMMQNELFGTKHVAVVKDVKDLNQERMHLDTVFNVVDKKHAFYLQSLLAPEKQRAVDEYEFIDGKYQQVQTDVEFSVYLQMKNLEIIWVSDAEQLDYAINFIQLGSGDLISISATTTALLNKYNSTAIAHYVDFDGIKRMFGAAHCSTQIFRKHTPIPEGYLTELHQHLATRSHVRKL